MKYVLWGSLFLAAGLLQAQPRPRTLEVALTGDIMMGTTYPSEQLPVREGRQLFVDVAPLLQRADLAFGNLEGALCDGGETHKKGKNSYAFRTPTKFAPRLSEAGYSFLSMANNHANDFGPSGLQSTMKSLDSVGIRYAGIAGMCETAMLEHDGLRIGVCAFGHNSYTLEHTDLDLVGRILRKLVAESDLVVVSFHGGGEGRGFRHLPYGKEICYNENRGSLRELARFCIDHGADLVYGHGPHVVRAVELYKNRFIAYSLGNFCTPYGMNLSGVSGYAPVVTVCMLEDGTFLNGKIHSFIQYPGKGPRKDKTLRVAHEVKTLTEQDVPETPLRISEDGTIMRVPVIPLHP